MLKGGAEDDKGIENVTIGIVGGGPVGMFAAIALGRILEDRCTITVYEKRTARTRIQHVYVDLANMLNQEATFGPELFEEIWGEVRKIGACLVTVPVFLDGKCFALGDFASLLERVRAAPSLGGLALPIRKLEEILEKIVEPMSNVTIERKKIEDVAALVERHQIILGCEGRHSVVADAIGSKAVPLVGVPRSKELHALLVSWKDDQPSQPQKTARLLPGAVAQQRYRFFRQTNGECYFVMQFRSKSVLHLPHCVLADLPERIQHLAREGLGSVGVDAAVLSSAHISVINIAPYRRSRACAILQTPKGTSLAALVGDSLMGVSFLSGWGLNSGLLQTEALRDAMEGREDVLPQRRRGSLTEKIWLDDLGGSYAGSVSDVVGTSVLRTLAVVSPGEFMGRDDMNESVLTMDNIVRNMNRTYADDPRTITVCAGSRRCLPLVEANRRRLLTALAPLASSEKLSNIQAWGSKKFTKEQMIALRRLAKVQKIGLLELFSGERSKPSRPFYGLDEAAYFLYNIQQLGKGNISRPNIQIFLPGGRLADDRDAAGNIIKSVPNAIADKMFKFRKKHARREAPLLPDVSRSSAVLALPIDSAWDAAAQITLRYPDFFVVVYSEKEAGGRFVRSKKGAQVTGLFTVRPAANMRSIENRDGAAAVTPVVKCDIRFMVIIDNKFGRDVSHLLHVLADVFHVSVARAPKKFPSYLSPCNP